MPPASATTLENRTWLDRIGLARLGERRLLWVLIVTSLAVRVFWWGLAVAYDIPVRGDEFAYHLRAMGFQEIIQGLASGEWPAYKSWHAAYGEGRWTPLHPLVLALGMLFGGGLATARFVVVLLSAATTPLVYVLARRMISGRAALAATAIHAFYPTFVAYSHYLFAETAFSLALVVTLILALAMRDENLPLGRRCRRGALAGLTTGLCFLIKPSAIFLMPVVPLWLCLRNRRREGFMIAAMFVAAWLMPWGVWSAAASLAEGRFVSSTANSGYGLYLGNNPWIPPGVGTYASEETKARMLTHIEAFAATTGRSPDDSARRLALAEITGHPLRFIARAVRRVQEHWFPDNFLLQHLYRGYYPPLGLTLASLIGIAVVVCYLALIALIARGFLAPGVVPRDLKWLWIGVIVALMVPSILVVAQSRYHMPSLVILLPFAGLALGRIRSGLPRNREFAWIAGISGFLLLTAAGLPTLIMHHTRPSGHYQAIFSPLARALGHDLHYADWISFRRLEGAQRGQMTFTLLGDDAAFFHTGESVAVGEPPEGGSLAAHYHRRASSTPLRLQIAPEGDQMPTVVIDPVDAQAWRRWKSTGVPGLEYRWDPTSAVVPTPAYFPSWPSR